MLPTIALIGAFAKRSRLAASLPWESRDASEPNVENMQSTETAHRAEPAHDAFTVYLDIAESDHGGYVLCVDASPQTNPEYIHVTGTDAATQTAFDDDDITDLPPKPRQRWIDLHSEDESAFGYVMEFVDAADAKHAATACDGADEEPGDGQQHCKDPGDFAANDADEDVGDETWQRVPTKFEKYSEIKGCGNINTAEKIDDDKNNHDGQERGRQKTELGRRRGKGISVGDLDCIVQDLVARTKAILQSRHSRRHSDFRPLRHCLQTVVERTPTQSDVHGIAKAIVAKLADA